MEYSYIPRAKPEISVNTEQRIFVISADLGQAQDYTAISVVEKIIKGRGVLGFRKEGEKSYHLRHIERPPRGTEYPAVVTRIEQIFDSPQLAEYDKAVVIDMTGVGRPVYDMMIARGFRQVLSAITITGGNTTTEHDSSIYGVPKRDLVTNLQVMLQNGALRIAKGLKEADALTDELMNFKTKITASGHDVYGARSGTHDDIVLSVAMGAWLAGKRWCKAGRGLTDVRKSLLE